MKVPQCTPGEGGRGDFEYFSNWSIGPGQEGTGWTAGRPVWVIGHPSDKGSKPCLRWMTKNALPCRFCALSKEPVQLGYVPVWRSTDTRAKFVIVYKSEREHVDNFPLHTRVKIARENEEGAALYVRMLTLQEPKFQTTLAHRMVGLDISDSLLVIWGLPELVSWLKCRLGGDNPLSLDAGEGVEPAREPVAEAPAAAAHKPDAQPYNAPGPVGADDTFLALGERVKGRVEKLRPSKNGKHDPK